MKFKVIAQNVIFVDHLGEKSTLKIEDKEKRQAIAKEIAPIFQKMLDTKSDRSKAMYSNKIKKILDATVAPEKKNKKREAAVKEVKTKARNKKLIKLSKKMSVDFRTSKGELFLKSTEVPLPNTLVKELTKAMKNETKYEALLNFWKLLLLNPSPNSRENTFDYINKNKDYIITTKGYLLGFRRVKVKKIGQLESRGGIDSVVTDIYFKLKGQKKSPKKFYIIKNKEGEFKHLPIKNTAPPKGYHYYFNGETVHDLYVKFADLPADKKVIFEPGHSRGKYGMHIEIGKPVEMPREECEDNPDKACSPGLHVGHWEATMKPIEQSWGTTYKNQPDQKVDQNTVAGDGDKPLVSIKDANIGMFGNVRIAVLVNPRDMVSVPHTYEWKYRCCRYFPIAVVSDSTFKEVVEKTRFDVFDDDYMDVEKSIMEDLIKNAKKLIKQGEISDAIDIATAKKIIKERLVMV